MRAVVFEEFGEPAEVLSLKELPQPQPAQGEVLVRMLICPINPSDLLSIRGIYGVQPKLPAIPGFEGVGVVEANGGGLLGRYFVGKRVAVLNRTSGNWCDKTVLPAKQVIPVANDLPLEQTAMFFVNPAAAYVMTQLLLKIGSGEWLLQTAAGSALGRMVIRLGKRLGFRTLNVVRREEQIDELKALGGDAVIQFDPTDNDPQKLHDDVMRLTGKKGVPYAIDPVGGAVGSAVVTCLAAHGRMLVYGTLTDQPLSFSPRVLMAPEASVEGFWLGAWMLRQKLLNKLRLVRTITRLLREGVFVSDVGESFSLDHVTNAVQAAEKVGRGGKVLLRIGTE